MKELSEIRNEIDHIDAELLKLFMQRMECAKDVALYKQAHNLPIFAPEREKEVIKKRLETLDDAQYKLWAERLFHLLMDLSKEQQQQVLGLQAPKQQSIPTVGVVAYQGLEGANQEQATLAYFGENVKRIACERFIDVFETVKNGTVSYGVLPIENSTAGSVFDVYDLLGETGCYIVGEQNLNIHHALMAKANTQLSDIQKVYSHPQALMQCESFLSKQQWEIIPYGNTAMAAQHVSESPEKNIAAIAAPRAAECYGLHILAPDIQDRYDNITRFVIIAAEPKEISGKGKISIMFKLKHQSGSLYKVLDHFATAKLNLTKIESRVIPSRSFEYRFYMDFEGDVSTSAVEKTLQELSELTQEVKVLGAYLTDAQRRI